MLGNSSSDECCEKSERAAVAVPSSNSTLQVPHDDMLIVASSSDAGIPSDTNLVTHSLFSGGPLSSRVWASEPCFLMTNPHRW